jgi:predicted GTPase
MGATGVGKSSVRCSLLSFEICTKLREQFINLAIANDRTAVGHHLHSCTQGVRAVRCSDPDNPRRKFVFLDTPGFDDTHKSDTQILMDIAEWLRET